MLRTSLTEVIEREDTHRRKKKPQVKDRGSILKDLS